MADVLIIGNPNKMWYHDITFEGLFSHDYALTNEDARDIVGSGDYKVVVLNGQADFSTVSYMQDHKVRILFDHADAQGIEKLGEEMSDLLESV